MAIALDNSAHFVVHPAAWLAPPLLQLAHAVLQVPHSDRRYLMQMVLAVVAASSPGFSLPAHPQLCALVTGGPGDAALGATAAAALRQVSL